MTDLSTVVKHFPSQFAESGHFHTNYRERRVSPPVKQTPAAYAAPLLQCHIPADPP